MNIVAGLPNSAWSEKPTSSRRTNGSSTGKMVSRAPAELGISVAVWPAPVRLAGPPSSNRGGARPLGSSGCVRRGSGGRSGGAGGSGGRSRRRWERGKAAGVASRACEGAILASGRARTTSRQRRPIARNQAVSDQNEHQRQNASPRAAAPGATARGDLAGCGSRGLDTATGPTAIRVARLPQIRRARPVETRRA